MTIREQNVSKITPNTAFSIGFLAFSLSVRRMASSIANDASS